MPYVCGVKQTHTAMTTYQTAQIQQVASKFNVEYANCGLSYIGGYVCEGRTFETAAVAWFGNWVVYFTEVNGAWLPIKASNGDTGTTYANPWTWFDKKMAKLAK